MNLRSIVILWALLATTVAGALPAQDQVVRTAKVHQGTPIAQLVGERPESVIEIAYERTPPLLVLPPEGTSRIEWKTQLFTDVMVVDVVGTRSRIDDGGTWVVTDVSARVVEVLKTSGRRSLLAGDEVEFLSQGGQVEVGSKVVRGVVEWALPFAEGRQYLLFFGFGPAGEMKVGPISSYERVLDANFRSMLRGVLAEDTDEPPDDVIATVRRVAGGQ